MNMETENVAQELFFVWVQEGLGEVGEKDFFVIE